MSVDTFDLALKLKERLHETSVEKERQQAKINAATEQLQRMIKTAPKKPRDSVERMDAKLKDLEDKRTKTSLPLSEEKAILRQIDMVNRSKRQLDEYNKHERSIKEKKDKLDELRESLRSTIAAIAELETALSKVELAKRLNCTPADLKSRVVDCPKEKLGQVIGKNGTNLRQIEERTGVHMDIDKVGYKIHLSGSDESLDRAVREVEAITLAVEEKISVSHATSSYILSSRRLGLLDMLQNEHSVYIDLDKGDESIMKIRGAANNVAAAVEEISSMDVTALKRDLSPRETPMVLGKGGSVVNALTDKHKVAINITKDKGGDSSTMEVVGPTDAAEAAFAEVESMIYENADIEESMMVQPMHRVKLLSNGGEGIKAVQAEINNEMGVTNVWLNFEKGDYRMTGPSNLVIKTKRANMARAKDLVQQRISGFEAECVTLTVASDIIPAIIGRGGATIKALRNEGAGGEIEVNKATGVINIQSDDAETRETIKAAIEDIVAKNQTIEIPIEKSMIGLLLGEPGKEMRNEVTNIGAALKMDSSDTHIVLRGTTEQINQCAPLVKSFIESNYMQEFEISPEDEALLFQGGDDSLLRRIEKEQDVRANFRKTTHLLLVRGKKEDVEAALRTVKQVFVGGDGFAVCRLPIPDGVVGTIIGKGGSNLKALEKDNQGVSIQIDRDSSSLCIRGPEDMVARVRSSIIATISSATLVESVLISGNQHESLVKSSTIRSIASNTNTQMSLTESSVRIRGVQSNVRDAKALLQEQLTGKYKTYIDLDSPQLVKVRSAVKDPSHFDRIRTSTNTEVMLDESVSAICIVGKRSNVKKAKTFALGFLDFILPSELERIKVPKPLMKSMGDPESLAKIAADSGASVSLDRDLSSILIRSSDPENVIKASEMVDRRIKDCEKLNYVQKFSHSDAWLLPKIIGKGGSSIQMLEKDSGCTIEVSKADLTVVISGDDENNVEAVKAKLNNVIDKAKKECVFIDVPESAMSAFIGKAGANVNALREDHNVAVDRIRKEPTRVQIQGSESNVATAKAAVEEWLKEWEAQHLGETIPVEEDVIPAILGSKGSVVNAIQKDLGVRIDIDRRSNNLTVRGGTKKAREEAMKKIEEITCQQQALAAEKEEARKQKSAEAAATRMESLAAAKNKIESAPDGDRERKIQPTNSDAEKKDRVDEFSSIPVGMTVTAGGTQKSSSIHTSSSANAKKENVLSGNGGTEAGRLVAMLMSDPSDVPSNVLADEQWDSSTVSSAVVSSNDQEDFEGGYYKSSSGFSVRL